MAVVWHRIFTIVVVLIVDALNLILRYFVLVIVIFVATTYFAFCGISEIVKVEI